MPGNPRRILKSGDNPAAALRRLEDYVRQLERRMDALGGGGGGTPDAHAASHEDGGSDEIDMTGLSGVLADPQTPAAHKTSHQSGGSDSIKLDDLATPDDNTDLNSTTGHHGLLPKLDGSASKALAGDGTWQNLASFGSAGLWTPDAAPASPSAYDDEFPGSSLDGKWSTWDPASILSTAVSNSQAKLTATGNGGVRFCGIYQAVPGTEYAFYTKAGVHCSEGETVVAAPFVSQDISGSPSTADFVTAEIYNTSGAHGWLSRRWDAYNGSASSLSTNLSDRFHTGVYIRGRVNGSTVSFDYSEDGISWHCLQVNHGFGSNPTHFGLCILVQTSGITRSVFFDFFRVFSGSGTSGFDATAIGRLL